MDITTHEKAYGGWSAEWWQWFLSIPADVHPALGGSCREGQSGKVFFLTADFRPGDGDISCMIPREKAIFFALVNVECSTKESPPFHGSKTTGH
jgi:hypothetical protein